MQSIDYKNYVKRYFIYLFSVMFIFVLIYCHLIYVLDPLQIFHKSWFHNDRLNPNMRIQAAGIINNFDFDSIILGTSMLENTSSKESSEKLGGKFFNISLSGSNFYERSFILNKSLHKNIKQVMYSLDASYLGCGLEPNDYKIDTWNFLYDDSVINDFKIYFTLEYVIGFSPIATTRLLDLDRPNAWFDWPSQSDRFGGLKNWVKNIDNKQVSSFLRKDLALSAQKSQNRKRGFVSTPEREKLARLYVDKYILKYVAAHPQTKFLFIFPPYYRFKYADWLQNNPEEFYLHQQMIRYFVEHGEELKNMQLYGFEDMDFLDDIANYKDTGHYHYRFNSFFLDAIASNTHRLTTENVEAYLAKCEQKAWDFDIGKLNDEVQKLLREKGIVVGDTSEAKDAGKRQ